MPTLDTDLIDGVASHRARMKPRGRSPRREGPIPEAWYLMDGPRKRSASDAGDVLDVSGNRAPARRVNECAWGLGPDGPCLRFAGVLGYADGGTIGHLPGTVSARFLTETTADSAGGAGYRAIVSTEDTSSNQPGGFDLFYVPSAGQVSFTVSDGSAYYAAGLSLPVVAGRWYHAVGVVGAGTVSLYIDGVLASSAAGPASPGATPLALTIGNALPDGERSWQGLIDDVRLYREPLTAAEVARLHADPYAPLRPRRAAAIVAASVALPPPPWAWAASRNILIGGS